MLRRNLTGPLLAALSDTPVVFLHGARQTGKSTLAKSLASSDYPARYFTLDDAAVLAAVKLDPAGFLAATNGPIVLDEVQRAPELFLAIKADVDRARQPGRFLLTGSADVLLLPQVAESLAGRMEILTLGTFSQGEIAGIREDFIDIAFAKGSPAFPAPLEAGAELVSKILLGGYPAVLERTVEGRRRAWFGSYLNTILQRDVRDIANIEGLAALPRLLALVATRSASLLNFSELSRSIAIPQSTLKRYMTLLETTFLIQFLPAWFTNLGKRLVKSPKLYLNDTGLVAYLLGANEERLADRHLLGPLLETFVVMELRKQASWSEAQPRFFHFRIPTGQEVDIVMENSAGEIVGVEVKAGATVGAQDLKGLRGLAELVGPRFRRGIVVYTGKECIPFGANLIAVPVNTMWTPATASL